MKKLVIILCLILILCMVMIPIKTYGTTIDPNAYAPSGFTSSDTTEITNKFGIIVSALRTIGIVVMVITMMVLGIKYMTGSIEERVEYKKSMIPYLIGATLFFTITVILSVIINLAGNLSA